MCWLVLCPLRQRCCALNLIYVKHLPRASPYSLYRYFKKRRQLAELILGVVRWLLSLNAVATYCSAWEWSTPVPKCLAYFLPHVTAMLCWRTSTNYWSVAATERVFCICRVKRYCICRMLQVTCCMPLIVATRSLSLLYTLVISLSSHVHLTFDPAPSLLLSSMVHWWYTNVLLLLTFPPHC